MIREQVMAMTDEALQLKVAELTGWTDIRCMDGIQTAPEVKSIKLLYGVPPSEWMPPSFESSTPGDMTKSGLVTWVLPNWPNDIAAAWKLVDRCSEIGLELDLSGADPLWEADFYKPGTGDVRPNFCRGETAKRAITRAFILAMEENHE